MQRNNLKQSKKIEDIWFGQPKIANSNTSKIWQQLTILTGYSLKIKQIGKELKKTAINKAEIACKKIFNQLTEAHFADSKKRYKKSVAWGDKAKFNKAIKPQLDIYDKQINKIFSEELIYLFEFFNEFDLEYLFSCYSLLDEYNQKQLIGKTNMFSEKIEYKINNPNYIENVFILKLSSSFDPTLNDWQKRFSDIYFHEVSILELKVISLSKYRINMIIDDRVKLAISIIEEMINFYSKLLKPKNSYF